MSKLAHTPTLATVEMIEQGIKKAEDYPTKSALWRLLPKRVMWGTLNVALNYLERSGKILFDDNKIIWISNPELLKKVVIVK